MKGIITMGKNVLTEDRYYTKLSYKLFGLRGKYEYDGKKINIRAEEIVLLSIINSLSTVKANTPCYASNAKLASLMNVPKDTVRDYTRNLENVGLIKKFEHKTGAHTDNRIIYIQWNRIGEILEANRYDMEDEPTDPVELPTWLEEEDTDPVELPTPSEEEDTDPVEELANPVEPSTPTLLDLAHNPVEPSTPNTIQYNNYTIYNIEPIPEDKLLSTLFKKYSIDYNDDNANIFFSGIYDRIHECSAVNVSRLEILEFIDKCVIKNIPSYIDDIYELINNVNDRIYSDCNLFLLLEI